MAAGTLRDGRPDRLYVPDKDPAYEYRWMNATAGPQGDQNIYMAQWEGWEAAPLDPSKVPSEVLSATATASSAAAGASYRRGDLVLFRMKKERYAEYVKQFDEARQRGETSLDTMVLQAQENAAKALRDRGQKRIPGNLVFREDVGDPT